MLESRAVYQASPFRTNPTNLWPPSFRLGFLFPDDYTLIRENTADPEDISRKTDGLFVDKTGLVICLTLTRRRSPSEGWTEIQPTGFKVGGEIAVTTEPAVICDLSFEVDTGTQKTWKRWN
ncbi:hypothetical protein BLNAU_22350 [Blattamonas nauphoetae]|uniref:Uncharacterized protein n=1 Tax=Blattamonas nauphoetae TaxID=2049346 RepID=A0ABQ9WVI2_9EUKA|nr:hypothetical protein BLNAU_22350 [Blattamonas nauphoetae]